MGREGYASRTSAGIADRLGEFGLAGTDIARKDDQRRPPKHRVDQALCSGLMPLRPALKTVRVNEERKDLGQGTAPKDSASPASISL